jgi:hypothetical protein
MIARLSQVLCALVPRRDRLLRRPIGTAALKNMVLSRFGAAPLIA